MAWLIMFQFKRVPRENPAKPNTGLTKVPDDQLCAAGLVESKFGLSSQVSPQEARLHATWARRDKHKP